jgi:hypothetical protein
LLLWNNEESVSIERARCQLHVNTLMATGGVRSQGRNQIGRDDSIDWGSGPGKSWKVGIEQAQLVGFGWVLGHGKRHK